MAPLASGNPGLAPATPIARLSARPLARSTRPTRRRRTCPEVLVFDLQRDRRLVAAVEIVSPANKDRPESRQLFLAKCFQLLRNDVCLSIVDLVTVRQFNLYAELLAMLNR